MNHMNHYSHEEVKFKLIMRRHMEDHTIWLRSYMVSLLGDLPDLDKLEERFLKNQDSIANCMREFFGDTVIDNLVSLRKEHASLTIDLLNSIKNKDVDKASSTEANLVSNAENISTLLSLANPFYSKEELLDLLNTNLILTKYEFIARMNGDYTADIMYFDMSMHHAVMIADYITKGIRERFFEDQVMDYNIQNNLEDYHQEEINQPKDYEMNYINYE